MTLQSQIEANPSLAGALEDQLMSLTMDLSGAVAAEEEAVSTLRKLQEEDAAAAAGAGSNDSPSSVPGSDAAIQEALRRSMEEDTLPDIRRFSASAPDIAAALRNLLVDQVATHPENGIRYVSETPPSFVVPQFAEKEMQGMVDKLLIDDYVTAHTTSEGILNWDRMGGEGGVEGSPGSGASKSVVLHTLGDGNCLCHAASLLLWRIHDRETLLRSCIGATLMPESGDGSSVGEIKARFYAERSRTDVALGILPPEEEALAIQWDEQLGIVMTEHSASRRAGYLSELHAFVLANVLRRPIVLLGGQDALLSGMVGVYLPLLWRDPDLVSKAPLLLMFNGAHFSAVTTVAGTSNGNPRSLYLATKAGLIPPRFLTEEEAADPDAILSTWLHVLSPHPTGEGVIIALDPPADPLVHPISPSVSPSSIDQFVATLQRQFFVAMRDETATGSATPLASATPRDGASAFAFPDP